MTTRYIVMVATRVIIGFIVLRVLYSCFAAPSVGAQTPTPPPILVVLEQSEEERRQEELIAWGGALGFAFLLIFVGAAMHWFAGSRR